MVKLSIYLNRRGFVMNCAAVSCYCFFLVSSALCTSVKLCISWVPSFIFLFYLFLGSVAQSIVSLKSSLVVKMSTVLSTISNLQVFLLKKNVNSFYLLYLMMKVITIR